MIPLKKFGQSLQVPAPVLEEQFRKNWKFGVSIKSQI
jgi:hypothetical protein